jgi:hypothetical protein
MRMGSSFSRDYSNNSLIRDKMHILKGDHLYSDIRDAFNHFPADTDHESHKSSFKEKKRQDFDRLFTNYRETNSSQLRQQNI